MADFFRNWLWWVHRAGMTNLVVGVADEASAHLVMGLGVTCVNLNSSLLPPGGDVPGGGPPRSVHEPQAILAGFASQEETWIWTGGVKGGTLGDIIVRQTCCRSSIYSGYRTFSFPLLIETRMRLCCWSVQLQRACLAKSNFCVYRLSLPFSPSVSFSQLHKHSPFQNLASKVHVVRCCRRQLLQLPATGVEKAGVGAGSVLR